MDKPKSIWDMTPEELAAAMEAVTLDDIKAVCDHIIAQDTETRGPRAALAGPDAATSPPGPSGPRVETSHISG